MVTFWRESSSDRDAIVVKVGGKLRMMAVGWKRNSSILGMSRGVGYVFLGL